MIQIKIALYKYKTPGWGSHATFDRLSRFVGGKFENWRWKPGKYSHVELVLKDSNGVWKSHSSSFRDGGVRGKYIDFTPGRWDFVTMTVTQEQLDYILFVFRIFDGHKYDWPALGVFLFGRTWPIRIPGWFFCSDICSTALRLPNPKLIHPCHLGNMSTLISENIDAN